MTIRVMTEKGSIKVIPGFRVSSAVRRRIEQTLRMAVEEAKPIAELLEWIRKEDPVVDTPRGALIAYMTGQGWTQKKLSKETGISQADISKMVNGKRAIGPMVARKLGKAFGVDYRRFL